MLLNASAHPSLKCTPSIDDDDADHTVPEDVVEDIECKLDDATSDPPSDSVDARTALVVYQPHLAATLIVQENGSDPSLRWLYSMLFFLFLKIFFVRTS